MASHGMAFAASSPSHIFHLRPIHICPRSYSLPTHPTSLPRFHRLRFSTTLASAPTTASHSSPPILEKSWNWPGHGTVSYLESAPSSTPSTTSATIIFIHGFGTSKEDFNSNIPAAVAAGHRALALDLLGLGSSTPSDLSVASSVTLSLWLAQIAAFTVALAPNTRVYFVGNSLGGLLATAYAASPSSTHAPLAGALLISPAPFWAALPRTLASRTLLRYFWARLTHPSGKVVARTLKLVFADPERVRPDAVERILEGAGRDFGQDVFEAVLSEAHGGGETWEAEFDKRVVDGFGGGTPLAIVYGKEDPWVVPLFGLRLKRLVPECDYFELSPCGHQAQIEASEAVNEILVRWVDGVEREMDEAAERDQNVGREWIRSISGKVIDGVKVALRDGEARGFFEGFAGDKNYGAVFAAAYASTFFPNAE